MLPIHELTASYQIIRSFVSDKALLQSMISHLFFVTAHIQMGLGHIGIASFFTRGKIADIWVCMIPPLQTGYPMHIHPGRW